MADEVASLVLRVDSTQAASASDNLDGLTAAGARAEKATKGVGTASAAAGAQMGAFSQAARTASTQAAAAGMSAGQLNNAMRMLPAQITDITVGLSTGQSPFMVMMQQGGQLKDMFGGLGPALRAVGGYVMGLATPISLVAAAVGALGFAYYRGAEETDRFEDAITMTGNAAGVTSGQLGVMAAAIGDVVGTTGRAADALAQLVETGEFASDVIERLATAALKMEEATGRSVEETVKQYRKIAEEPAKAIAELNRQQNFLTAGQYEAIRALERQGEKQEAARVALLAYASATERSADVIVGRAGYIERAWDAVWRAVRRAGSELANLGRDTGLEGELARAEERLTQLQDAAYERGAANRVRQVQEQKAIVAEIRERVRMQQRLAANERQQGEIQRAAVEAQQEIEKARDSSASQQVKLNKALKEYRDNIEAIRRADPNSAFLDPKKIAADEAALREQFKERGGNKGLSAAARAIQQAREQEASLRAQLDSAVKITSARQELVQFEQRIADIKAKAQRTADEKSLLASEDSLRAQLETNAGLADQITLQKEAVDLRVAERSALETLAADQERYSSLLETFAAGPRLREQMEAQRELYRDFQRQTQRAAEQQAAGELTPQGYADRLRLLRENLDQRLTVQADYFTRLRAMESDWQLGAQGGLADYADEASNVAEATRSAFADAFKGAEDALVSFVTSGKLSFTDLANSIVQDLARIAIRQSITGPLAGALGQALGGMWGGGGMTAGADMPGIGGTAGGLLDGVQFASGGYTGDGGRDQIAGIVHGQEYVLNADATARIGRATLDAVNAGGRLSMSGGSTGYSDGAAGGLAVPSVTLNVINQTRQQVEATSSPPRYDGKRIIIDTVLTEAKNNPGFRRQLQEA